MLLAMLAAGACGFGSTPAPKASHHPSPTPSVRASPSPQTASAYWVISTLGLRLHEAPDPASNVVTVLRTGARLDVSGSSQIGPQLWLHVSAHDSPDLVGWVLADPTLVTATAMQQHEDPTSGYTLLFPADWNFQAGGANASFFNSPDGSTRLTVETTDSVAHLPPEPTTPGTLASQAGPVDIYGTTQLVDVYKLSSGSFELATSFLYAPGRAFGFVWRAPSGDLAPFSLILGTVTLR
jgi:hypothetical protein